MFVKLKTVKKQDINGSIQDYKRSRCKLVKGFKFTIIENIESSKISDRDE
jgi:hypothetical protein